MDKEKKGGKIYQVQCPDCKALLWIDTATHQVIKKERAKKKKGSLDDLLDVERKRRAAFAHKFEATAELEKKKREKAKEKFQEALKNLDKD
jgi:hypothetical protein